MRGGRFGSKAGRAAVVVALVLGTLVAGATAAAASDDTAGSPLGRIAAEVTTAGQVTALENGWE